MSEYKNTSVRRTAPAGNTFLQYTAHTKLLNRIRYREVFTSVNLTSFTLFVTMTTSQSLLLVILFSFDSPSYILSFIKALEDFSILESWWNAYCWEITLSTPAFLESFRPLRMSFSSPHRNIGDIPLPLPPHTQTTRMRTLILRVWINPPPSCPSRSSIHDHKFVTQWHRHMRFSLPVSMLDWRTSSWKVEW